MKRNLEHSRKRRKKRNKSVVNRNQQEGLREVAGETKVISHLHNHLSHKFINNNINNRIMTINNSVITINNTSHINAVAEVVAVAMTTKAEVAMKTKEEEAMKTKVEVAMTIITVVVEEVLPEVV